MAYRYSRNNLECGDHIRLTIASLPGQCTRNINVSCLVGDGRIDQLIQIIATGLV